MEMLLLTWAYISRFLGKSIYNKTYCLANLKFNIALLVSSMNITNKCSTKSLFYSFTKAQLNHKMAHCFLQNRVTQEILAKLQLRKRASHNCCRRTELIDSIQQL